MYKAFFCICGCAKISLRPLSISLSVSVFKSFLWHPLPRLMVHLQRVPMLADLRLHRLSSNTSCEELKLLDNITLPSLAKVLLVGGRARSWEALPQSTCAVQGKSCFRDRLWPYILKISKAIGWVPKWLLCRAFEESHPDVSSFSSPQVWEETTQSLETRKKMTVKLFGPAAGVSCHIVMIPSSRWPLKSAFFLRIQQI